MSDTSGPPMGFASTPVTTTEECTITGTDGGILFEGTYRAGCEYLGKERVSLYIWVGSLQQEVRALDEENKLLRKIVQILEIGKGDTMK